jgi:hypothetical protein
MRTRPFVSTGTAPCIIRFVARASLPRTQTSIKVQGHFPDSRDSSPCDLFALYYDEAVVSVLEQSPPSPAQVGFSYEGPVVAMASDARTLIYIHHLWPSSRHRRGHVRVG